MKKKNLGLALLLSLIGPLGMLYFSTTGCLTFFVINIFIAIINYIKIVTSGGYEIWYFLYFISICIGTYWSYNVITEKNRRFVLGETAITNNEEFNCGFKNFNGAILNFLISLFFTCMLYAFFSITKIFNENNETFQIVFSLLVFIVIFVFSILKEFKSVNNKT